MLLSRFHYDFYKGGNSKIETGMTLMVIISLTENQNNWNKDNFEYL